MSEDIGQRFAAAVAAKDTTALLGVLAPEVDFMGLTSHRFWTASTAAEVVDDVILGAWFEPSDSIEEVEQVVTGVVGDRSRVGYRLRVTNPSGTHTVEQQAYFGVEDGRITWLRMMCSGFRPAAVGVPAQTS